MDTELKLPELGENVETAVVGSVLVSPGDTIRKDQPVIEVETDKATAEVPSPFAGVVKEIRVRKGGEIRVGEVILTLETDGAAAGAGQGSAAPAKGARAASEKKRAKTGREESRDVPAAREVAPRVEPASGPTLSAGPSPETGRAPDAAPPPALEGDDLVPAAPSVRRLARELGIDIARVRGTGPGERISSEDVTDWARGLIGARGLSGETGATGPAGGAAGRALPDFTLYGEVHREPMSGVRRRTAENVAASWSIVPHVTQFDQADITELEVLRRRWGPRAEAAGGKLTVTSIILKAAAAALKVFPRFNASLDDASQEIVYRRYVHLGVAVDAGYGLLVPVIRDADRKNILTLAAELADLSRRARDKKITVDELRGAGFTVTNLGGLGTTHFAPIVLWPQVAILGVGRAATQAVHRDGVFVPRLILPLSVSYDHRVIDGADAARFLRWIAEALEEPLKIALEG